MSSTSLTASVQPKLTLAEPSKVPPLVWQAHPTQPHSWHLINSASPNTILGTVQGQWPEGYTVEAYSSKGGHVILLHSPLGLSYFLFPGAQVQGDTFKLSLEGTVWQEAQQRPTPKASLPPPPQVPVAQAMILGAGIGTRILPLTEQWTALAKPSLPLDGAHSVIGRLVHHLAYFGLKHCYVNTFFAAPSVEAALTQAATEANTHWHNLPETRATGTAGGLVQLLQNPDKHPNFDPTLPLLVVQGDAVTNADFGLLMAAHLQHQPLVTLGCQIVSDEDVSKFGIIATQTTNPTDPSGVVTSFIEKPSLEAAGDHRLGSTGFYVLSPKVYPLVLQRYNELLAQQPAGHSVDAALKEFDFANDLFPWLLQQDASCLRAQAVDGYWCDIGNPTQYFDALVQLAEGRLPLTPAPAWPTGSYDATAGVLYWPEAKALADSDTQVLELSNGVLVAKTEAAL